MTRGPHNVWPGGPAAPGGRCRRPRVQPSFFPLPLPAYLAPVRATTRATGAAAVIIDKYPTVTCLALTFVTVLPWDLRRSNQGNAARCGDRGRGA